MHDHKLQLQKGKYGVAKITCVRVKRVLVVHQELERERIKCWGFENRELEDVKFCTWPPLRNKLCSPT